MTEYGAHFNERYVARAGYLGVLLKGRAALPRIRDSRVLNQQVEAAKFPADALHRVGKRNPVSDVELERDGARSDLFGCGLATLKIARPDQDGEAVRNELPRVVIRLLDSPR
jgi:hypothetical protein